jgi:hypothetical protein
MRALGARLRACGYTAVTLALLGVPCRGQTASGPQDYAIVDMDRFHLVGEQAVQRGQTTGSRRFLLRADTNYRLFKLDRASLRVGYVAFKSGGNGSRFTIPPVPLRALSSSQDMDADGLSDLGEWILGSDPNDPDSDDDGVLDGAAAQAGTLSQPLLRTGLIASLQLPGNAQDVAALNELAVVALGARGVAVTNVFTRMNPLLIGLVDTPGDARRVACSGSLVAVADGAAGSRSSTSAIPRSRRSATRSRRPSSAATRSRWRRSPGSPSLASRRATSSPSTSPPVRSSSACGSARDRSRTCSSRATACTSSTRRRCTPWPCSPAVWR